jgi:hypothetical protein
MAKKCKVICILKASSKVYDRMRSVGEYDSAERIFKKRVDIAVRWAEVRAAK